MNRPGRYPSATAGPTQNVIATAMSVPVRVCDDCAVQYVDWWANEDLWALIVGSYEGSLCFDCFRYRCHQKEITTVVVDSMARFEGREGRDG